MPNGDAIRRHDLDALRAGAMLLGLVLHAALSFLDIPWAVQDSQRAPWMGLVTASIHGFRMPLFFMISGYFTAMLWQKRGTRGLIKHRAKRIALPLAIGTATLVPLTWGIIIWSAIIGGADRDGDAPPDPTRDIWTAAAFGDTDALLDHIEAGAPLNAEEPVYGQSPLAWSIITDQRATFEVLLDAGADPGATYRDANAPMHTAAFFGRAWAAEALLEAGAAPFPVNANGETPLDSAAHGEGITMIIAGALGIELDFAAVRAGRAEIVAMLESLPEEDGAAAAPDADAASGNGMRLLGPVLFEFPFFHYLWFLWFLCWLVAAFAIAAPIATRLAGALPRGFFTEGPASALLRTPACLVYLLPLTALTQSLMRQAEFVPTFGPDTSAGMLPMPHVLAHYAVFFGGGALLYAGHGIAPPLARGWKTMLTLAVLMLPLGLAVTHDLPLAEGITDERTRDALALATQAAFPWLLTLGLIGLGERVLSRERYWVRYLSDASYWLYLAHLPPIVIGQLLIRDADLPASLKLTVLIVVPTAILMVMYRYLVRYTIVGRLLNGRRARPERAATPREATADA